MSVWVVSSLNIPQNTDVATPGPGGGHLAHNHHRANRNARQEQQRLELLGVVLKGKGEDPARIPNWLWGPWERSSRLGGAAGNLVDLTRQ